MPKSMKGCLLGEPFLMLLEKGLTMAFSQVQVFEAVGERSGVMGTGRWAAPCSACMYAAVA